jgi:hypothetical protein
MAWCPQLVVLAHEAVGCLVVGIHHWKLSLGVPMIVMPI